MNVTLALSQVEVGPRLRAVDPEKVREIAESWRQVGQLTAILVTPLITPEGALPRYRLVAGAHRFAAGELVGAKEIRAEVVEGTDDELRLIEIDENLYRHELNPFDEATFLAERKEIYERLHPEAGRGGARRGIKLTSSSVWSKSFAADVAERIGLNERSVFRAIARFTALAPEARTAISGTSIAKTGAELDALIKIPRERQAEVARWVLSEREAGRKASITDARVAVLSERAMIRADVGYRALLGAWRKASGSERRRFLDWLRDDAPEMFDRYLQAREDELARDGEAPSAGANDDGLASPATPPRRGRRAA